MLTFSRFHTNNTLFTFLRCISPSAIHPLQLFNNVQLAHLLLEGISTLFKLKAVLFLNSILLSHCSKMTLVYQSLNKDVSVRMDQF